jgi:hypothetical protein
MWHGLNSAVPYIWCRNLGEVIRTLRPGAAPLAFVSCPPPDLLLRLGVTLLPGLPALPGPEVHYSRYASLRPRSIPGTHHLAQGRLANQLGHFPLDSNPGWGCPLLGTRSGDTHTLFLSLSCSPSLFSLPLPRMRAQQPLQLTITKRQPDDSALLA